MVIDFHERVKQGLVCAGVRGSEGHVAPLDGNPLIVCQAAEKLRNVALSANSDLFGNTSWRSGTPANSMFEPEGGVLNLQ